MELITLIKYCLSVLCAGEGLKTGCVSVCACLCVCAKWLKLWLRMGSAVNIHG